jgi:VIT1/CCC1 family predicted Fe2+/Mn2+ transporter
LPALLVFLSLNSIATIILVFILLFQPFFFSALSGVNNVAKRTQEDKKGICRCASSSHSCICEVAKSRVIEGKSVLFSLSFFLCCCLSRAGEMQLTKKGFNGLHRLYSFLFPPFSDAPLVLSFFFLTEERTENEKEKCELYGEAAESLSSPLP